MGRTNIWARNGRPVSHWAAGTVNCSGDRGWGCIYALQSRFAAAAHGLPFSVAGDWDGSGSPITITHNPYRLSVMPAAIIRRTTASPDDLCMQALVWMSSRIGSWAHGAGSSLDGHHCTFLWPLNRGAGIHQDTLGFSFWFWDLDLDLVSFPCVLDLGSVATQQLRGADFAASG